MTDTSLNFATWNVRSLGQGIQGARKHNDIRNFFDNSNPKVEIILLQEHCYSIEDCFSNTQQLQLPGGVSFWNNSLYPTSGDKYHAGTTISLSKNLVSKVTYKGVPIEGRAQFVTILINKQSIGILNVYAPNETGPCSRFWTTLADFPFAKTDWLLARDMNMTEYPEDRSSDFLARAMGRRETGAWSRLLMNLGLQDIFYSEEFQRIGSKQHTWRREKPRPTWSRLDRFYAGENIRKKGGRHGIWRTFCHMSDHASAFVQVTMTSTSLRPPSCFNRSHIEDEEAQTSFIRAWRTAMAEQGNFYCDTRDTIALEHIR